MSGPVESPLRWCRYRRNVSARGWRRCWRSSHVGRTGSVEGHGDRVAGRFTGALITSVALAMLAACSSPGSSATTTDTAGAPTTVSATNPPLETTTIAPSDTSTSTTSISTTVPPTTAVPTITEPPDAEHEVREALVRVFDDFSACLTALPFCDPASLEATRAGDLLDRNVSRIQEWNTAGYAVRDRDQFRFVIEDVEVTSAGTAAIAVVCIADGSKLVLPVEGGQDVIIDDEFVSGREAWEMRLDSDGVWRAYGAPGIGETSGTDLCGGA